MTRAIATVLLGLAALVAIIVANGGGGDYTLRVPLENAAGLKDGSPVVVGGVTQGEVDLELEEGDRVVAELTLDDDIAPVGEDATVAVAAQNFLGQKRVQLDTGDASRPAPSGYEVPAENVTTPTDLDQVLNVLDADTRTRAMVLLNEAGAAVLGRRVDIRTLIGEFPVGFRDGTRVLRQLDADDRKLSRLVDKTDRLVAEFAQERRDLVRLVDTVGDTAENLGARRTELAQTLDRAPGTLRTLQGFLGDLEATVGPLRPAARAITESAQPLTATLDEVEPFGAAAIPVLRKATDVAPALTRLASDATPVLRRAEPTVAGLATLSKELVGTSRTLDGSAHNLLAILENWSRAIQFRDGLGHVFRGEASITPEALTSGVSRLLPDEPAKKRTPNKTPARKPAPAPAPKPAEKPAAKKPAIPALPPAVQKLVDELPLLEDLEKLPQAELPKSVTGLLDKAAPPQRDAGGDRTGALLDYLLGG